MVRISARCADGAGGGNWRSINNNGMPLRRRWRPHRADGQYFRSRSIRHSLLRKFSLKPVLAGFFCYFRGLCGAGCSPTVARIGQNRSLWADILWTYRLRRFGEYLV